MTQMVNLPPVSMAPAVNYAYSTAGVVDIGWKFATLVNDTDGKLPLVSMTPVANN